MRKALILTFVVALAPLAASAHVVRHNSVPEVYWGTWVSGEGACSADNKSAIVLSAKEYVGPAGKCSVDYVSETPGANGAIYSARLLCPATGAQKKIANLIFRSAADGGISAGPTFARLKAHRRCSASAPAAKK